MKRYQVTGRVVSHALFQPNPKDLPELELCRVALSLSPATPDGGKHTKAVLVVETGAIEGDLALGQMLQLTIEEHPQQNLFGPAGRLKEEVPIAVAVKSDRSQLELVNTSDDLGDDEGEGPPKPPRGRARGSRRPRPGTH